MTILDGEYEEEELDLAAPETRAAGRWNFTGKETNIDSVFGS